MSTSLRNSLGRLTQHRQQIGYLGDIVFRTNSRFVQTPTEATWSGSARYTEHPLHLGDALAEFTGLNLDNFAFKLQLCRDLGVDPLEAITKIWTYEREATALRLVLGTRAYGKHRWVIRDHSVEIEHYDAVGNISVASVTVHLLEYT